MKKIYFLLFSVMIVLTANSQTAELYKDINLINQSSNPAYYTTVGGKVFFTATEPLTGKELYVTDGTTGGTIVIDIYPGKESSDPFQFTEMNGLLYFSAIDNASNGTELWRSDGTIAGTTIVKNIAAFVGRSSNPTQLTNVNGILYFVASGGGDPDAGKEVWKSDGTAAGTVLVKDINPGYRSSNPLNLTAVGNTLYFAANNGTHGNELWRTSVTDNKTEMVKNINPGGNSDPYYLTNLNGVLFFVADDGITGPELWESNGTEAGTKLVKDIREGLISSDPSILYAFEGNLYFKANDGTNGAELWKFNSTTRETAMFVDIYPGSNPSSPGNFLAIGSTFYFTAFTPENGGELWKTDGSVAGTSLVKDLNPGTGNSGPAGFINFNETLYFHTSIPVRATWKSDGTPGGTVVLNYAVIGGEPFNGHAGPNKIYFSNIGYKEGIPSTETGIEPWVTDGTEDATILLKDINTRNNPSSPKDFCKIGNTIYFTADDGIIGRALWKTDGTAVGTTLVKDFGKTGFSNSRSAQLTNVNGTLYFIANTDVAGDEIWKSDGTEAGTTILKDIYPGNSGGAFYSSLAGINGVLYFSVTDATTGTELWKSDGTEAGTVMVKDINPGSAGSYPSKFTEVNGTVFFTANNGLFSGDNDEELWKTDGTPEGTLRVKDIRPGAAASSPTELTSFKNKLFFLATDGTSGNKLWVSDGTPDGTVLFQEGYHSNLTVLRDTMYFVTRINTSYGELWKTDGTAEGTVKVNPTKSIGNMSNFTLFKGSVFFTAHNYGMEGIQLWKTDGSEEGTVLVSVKNLFPSRLTVFKGTLYFRSTNELWKSDGTEEGTVSLNLDALGESKPTELTVLDDRLIFTANRFYTGNELWRIENFALPLTLLDFTAQKNGDKVLLKWETTNEVNTSVFEIERSGKADFVKIGEVSAINRTGHHRYSSYDEQPLKGTNLYRLKMIDINGSFTYSNIQRVDFNSVEQVRISPNPASNELKISDVKGYEMLQVMDASGRVVHQQKISGDQQLVNIQKLLPGNYVVRLTGKGIQKSLQFVKK